MYSRLQLSLKKLQNPLFASLVLILNIFFFTNAFRMNFFKDDFFFLKISRISDIAGFINFFSPIRTYSYKPLASEVFYFLINENAFLGHIIVFVTYFTGLYFLYKICIFLTKSVFISRLIILIYSLSSVHVFQLYWLATYQEILVLTLLAISFYLYLRKKYIPSTFSYVGALLSKETAILYVVFLFFVHLGMQRKTDTLLFNVKKVVKDLAIYIVVSFVFFLIYQYSLKFVTSLDNYKMDFNLKRIVNNALWYFLWSLGFPNFLPDYMKSIFSLPIPAFWNFFNMPHFKIYFYTFLSYVIIFTSSLILFILNNRDKAKRIALLFAISLVGFFLFLGPILFFPHRWMVRLTIPLFFISLFQSYVLFYYARSNVFFKAIFIILLSLYLVTNYFGTKVQENTSMFNLESKIVSNADIYFKQNKSTIEKKSKIYFVDNPSNKTGCEGWGGCAKKLENSFHGQFFLDYYFPEKNIKAYYDSKKVKNESEGYLINSTLFFK